MDLSRITIKPRVRNPYESIDLGLIMARSWWKPLYLSWLIPSFIFYLILSIIFYEDNWLALLLTWWLKPLWDRVPLYIASRKIFNDDVQVKEIIKALPKIYLNDIFAWLLWRRFSFTRSFDMPVTVLESLKHTQRRKRLDTLHKDSSTSASWLTIVCVHLEMIIFVGVVGFFLLLVPEEVDISFKSLIVDEDYIIELVTNIVTFFCMSLIAPFYTMAGFSLYINRRIKLEAWDIEIRFRHLAEKNKEKTSLVALSFIFISCLSVLTMPNDVYAKSSNSLTSEKSTVIINEVLKGNDFHKKKKVSGWRLKDIDSEKSDEEVPQWLIMIVKFLESLFGESESEDNKKDFTVAKLMEMFLWVIIILLVVYAVYRILKYLDIVSPKFGGSKTTNPVAPDILFGLDVRKDSIPEDVKKQTLLLWNAGQHREAIGLLYRSTLSLLIHEFSFEFHYGYTEQECSNIVQQSDNPLLRKFVSQVTHTWQQIAYAHSIPLEQQINSLCDQWAEVSNNEK